MTTTALFSAWYFGESSFDDSPSGVSGGETIPTPSSSKGAGKKRKEVVGRHTFEIAPDLIERVRSQDVLAFDTLVQIAFEPLVRFAYSFVQTQDAAEDIVQDVFVRVWQLGSTWRPTGSAAAYLLAAVRNEALKVLRHRRVAARYQEHVQGEWLPDETAGRLLGPDELLVWRERMRAFETVLLELTERQRSAFVLRYEQGLTVPAIASVLGIGTKGAEKLVSRVTHLLRERLRDIR